MIEQAIVEILLANSELTAIVGNAIRPVYLADTDRFPCVVFQKRPPDEPIIMHGRKCELEKIGLLFDIYANSQLQGMQIASIIREQLDHYTGYVAGLNIRPCIHMGTSDETPAAELGKGQPITHIVSDYELFHRPAPGTD